MWYLIAENNPDIKYGILGGKVYIVGRRDCDIMVTGDASVSRKHAELSVSHTEANLTDTSRMPILRLTDLSKFGTWVNKQRVEGDRILKDGDVVYFGSPNTPFMIVYEPLVVTTSCLDTAGKKSLRKTLCMLGGHMVNDWKKDCSLLIMNKINVTVKVICAMVSLKPIVSPAYMEDYVKYHQGTGQQPDPKLFIPELAETQVDPSEVSFNTNDKRKTIFRGKTFVFLSQKQLKKMSLAIELGGGLPILMEHKLDSELLLAQETIVMNCPDITKDNQALCASVNSLLKKNDKRLIPDADIGYAVLYCSTDKYCNPEHVPGRELSQLPSQTLSQGDPFACNTETQNRGGTQRHISQVHTDSAKRRSQQEPETETMTLVAIKDEPLSGKGQSQTKGRKRQRVDDTFEENQSTPKLKKIKDETASPAPKTLNQSKKTLTSKQMPEPVWDSDDNDIIGADITDSRELSHKKMSQHRAMSPGKNVTLGEHKQNSKSRSRSRSPVKSKNSAKLSIETALKSKSPAGMKVHNKTSSKSASPRRSSSRSPNRIKVEQDELSEIIPNPKAGSSPSRRVNDGAQEDFEDSDSKPELSERVPVHAGFLTTRKPIQTQVQRNKDYEEDQELPKACIQVEFKSLLAKKPQLTMDKEMTHCPDGYTRWKGKIIKNFKKFRKTKHSGSQELPNIIGGSALEVHLAQRSKEMDDWFKEAAQADSQHATEERRAKDLFDYDPSAKRRGR